MVLVRTASPRRLCATDNLCFEKKCENYQIFLSENFPFLVVKVSIYLNRRVFVMQNHWLLKIISIIVKAIMRLFSLGGLFGSFLFGYPHEDIFFSW